MLRWVKVRIDNTPRVRCSLFSSLNLEVRYPPHQRRKNNRRNKTGGRNKDY